MRTLELDGPLCETRQNSVPSSSPAQDDSGQGAIRDYVSHVVPAEHGFSFPVSAGSRFRVVDLHGQQVVDFMAWTRSSPANAAGVKLYRANLHEKVSMAYTRFHLSGAPPVIGEGLWTNTDKQLLTVTADTCKVHDMTFMSCYPELYDRLGRPGHRSCAANMAEAMAPWGMGSYLEIADPFNIFQNTPHYSLKGGLNPSREGDYIEFEASEDCVCAVSCCPFDIDGFNGGKVTDIAVLMERKDHELWLQIRGWREMETFAAQWHYMKAQSAS